ncbi:LIM domain [Popillia japonica]|uniref:LIM domain n=1 Tax=Popillia japonica TaxID=7064 RepID=A0AAW1N453_POPJA
MKYLKVLLPSPGIIDGNKTESLVGSKRVHVQRWPFPVPHPSLYQQRQTLAPLDHASVLAAGPRECAGCGKRITERFLLKALDLFWHEDCLKCGCCDCRLGVTVGWEKSVPHCIRKLILYYVKETISVLNKITEPLPSVTFNQNLVEIPEIIELADLNFFQCDKVDVLLGSTEFWHIIQNGNQRLYGITLQHTLLGHIVTGELSIRTNNCSTSYLSVERTMERFWQVEDCHTQTKHWTKEEQYCIDHYQKTYSRNEEGRYIVSLPKKEEGRYIVSLPKKEDVLLGNSFDIAKRRLYSMENKIKKDVGLSQQLFGTTGYCAACNKVIPAFEMVMRAKSNVYHLECFACQQCNHRFCVGDRFYLCDNKILCEYDYEERLVFANMAYNPSSLAHIRRQVSNLQVGSIMVANILHITA